jgi:hypothetical protein
MILLRTTEGIKRGKKKEEKRGARKGEAKVLASLPDAPRGGEKRTGLDS